MVIGYAREIETELLSIYPRVYFDTWVLPICNHFELYSTLNRNTDGDDIERRVSGARYICPI